MFGRGYEARDFSKDAIFADQSLKETPEEHKRRMEISHLIRHAESNHALSDEALHVYLDKGNTISLTKGQIIKLRSLNCRVFEYDFTRAQPGWFYWDVDEDLNIVKSLMVEEVQIDG